MIGQDSEDADVTFHGSDDHGRGLFVILGIHVSSSVNEHLGNLVFITSKNKRYI